MVCGESETHRIRMISFLFYNYSWGKNAKHDFSSCLQLQQLLEDHRDTRCSASENEVPVTNIAVPFLSVIKYQYRDLLVGQLLGKLHI